MGFLSDSARKAYKRGVRRAHVPEWFMPASYAFATLCVLIVGVLALRGGESRSFTVEPVGGANNVVVNNGTGTTTGTATSAPSSTESPDVDGAQESVATVDGGTVTLPAGAEAAARAVARAIFTGDFDAITLYPGQTAPVVIAPVPAPEINGVTGAQTFDDGSIQIGYQVDPDGAGPQKPREVSVLVVLVGAQWAYLPG